MLLLRTFGSIEIFQIGTCYFQSLRVLSKLSIHDHKMRILNVAEKNDAAKSIASYLSAGNVNRREGRSVYNKIYEFDYNFGGQNSKMVMTSVSGHLLTYEFIGQFKKWTSCSPESLFEAPVVKICPDNFLNIKTRCTTPHMTYIVNKMILSNELERLFQRASPRPSAFFSVISFSIYLFFYSLFVHDFTSVETLEREIRTCNVLIIWTDCDREGENIGFEIISVCTNIKPNIQIYRAKFSEITRQSVRRAMENLGEPHKLTNDAVDVRSELDLRIGAAFTRFQTLRLTKVFPDILGNCLISYGSCQFPTLGFVVERYKSVQNFIPESFWKIKVTHKIRELTVEFSWNRVRLFDQLFCQVLHEKCTDNPSAKVELVQTKPKSKWRPTPLDTVELEKTASRKLKINAKETMRIAERLYAKGFISYPRTETNIFPKDINLNRLVEMHVADNRWGPFAERILQNGAHPRQGKKSDQAHPPIHPTKIATGLSGNDAKVYEYIVRHFLACVSKDAEGLETIVKIDINEEKFTTSGLQILELNYLEVYPYEKWNAREIHAYGQGENFVPTTIDLVDGQTSAPHLLTEADLIALMEKHGIGTDATHAEHIETIKQRMYVGLQDNIYFVPGELGIGLVEGYDSMGFEMSKPHLRAELEADLKRICLGTKDSKQVLTEQINKYREVFRKAVDQANKIDAALNKYLQTNAVPVANDLNSFIRETQEFALKCSICGSGMVLKNRENNTSYITCTGYPQCRNAIWFPSKVLEAEVSSESCSRCGPDVRKINFKFRPGSMAPFYQNTHTGCVAGCDEQLLQYLEIQPPTNRTGMNTIANRPSNEIVRNIVPSWNPPANSNQSRINDSPRVPSWSAGRSNHPWTGNSHIPSTSGYNPFQPASTVSDDVDIQCDCGISAKRFTVQKESVNKGRPFYVCSKPQGNADRCSFFMWADANDNAPPSRPNFNNPRGSDRNRRTNSNTPSNFRAKRTTVNLQRAGRKCGVCRGVGHTRNNCPQLRD